MKNKGEYSYRINKTNGEKYLQIWRKLDDGREEFVRSCGSASKLLKILVMAEELEKKTKEIAENLTKI